jgi:hypothetical protein
VNYRQLVHGLLLQAQARKQLAKNMDLNAATVLFVGAIQGLVMQALMAGHLSDIAEQATTVYDIYEQGLVQPMPSSTRTKA